AAAEAPTPQMTVTGQARLEISPDCADLTISLVADSPQPAVAARQLGAQKAVLVAALSRAGVGAADVKLSTLDLDPIYEETPRGWDPVKVRTYRAQLTVVATTRDFARIPDIMQGASDAGARSISNQFRRSDLPELKKKVRDQALAAAKAKAK